MRDWGICEAPAVIRSRGRETAWGSPNDPPEPLVPDPWPAADAPEWHHVQRRILDHFAFAVSYPLRLAGQRPPARASLRLAHPADEAMIEQLRAIHNGEMPQEYDPETGRAYPPPRVWRHEVEWQAVWIVELTV